MNQPRIRVAVVFGGRSTEHGVSCVSAGSVLRHLDQERYEVVPVGITTDGAWVLGSAETADTPCSVLRPPNTTATRILGWFIGSDHTRLAERWHRATNCWLSVVNSYRQLPPRV